MRQMGTELTCRTVSAGTRRAWVRDAKTTPVILLFLAVLFVGCGLGEIRFTEAPVTRTEGKVREELAGDWKAVRTVEPLGTKQDIGLVTMKPSRSGGVVISLRPDPDVNSAPTISATSEWTRDGTGYLVFLDGIATSASDGRLVSKPFETVALVTPVGKASRLRVTLITHDFTLIERVVKRHDVRLVKEPGALTFDGKQEAILSLLREKRSDLFPEGGAASFFLERVESD